MENNTLPFLDTEIRIENNCAVLYNYSKSEGTKIYQDYRNSVSPRAYKTSTLSGEIHRMRNSTSTNEAFEQAISKMKQNFIRNNYPETLVNNKVNEIVGRNFEKSEFRKSQILKQKQNTQENTHILKIPFTSLRISPIITKIKKLIHKFIPNFNLRIVHSTISIKNLINFHIKPSIDPLATSNVVYWFECECDSVYIGETQQCLRNRIWQHRYRDSHIGKHIDKCIPYKAALSETL